MTFRRIPRLICLSTLGVAVGCATPSSRSAPLAAAPVTDVLLPVETGDRPQPRARKSEKASQTVEIAENSASTPIKEEDVEAVAAALDSAITESWKPQIDLVDYELPGPTLATTLDEELPLPGEMLPIPAASGYSGGAWSIDDAEMSAVGHHPGLSAASAAVEKATGIWCQSGLKPNPLIGYSANEMGADGQAGQQGVYWQQTFVRGDKLRLNREVEAWEVEKLKWEAEMLRVRVVTDVRTQFYAALGAQRKFELAGELVKSAGDAVDISRRLFEAGEVAEADVVQAQVQAAEIGILQDNAQADFTAEWRKLAALTGWPTEAPGTLVGELNQGDAGRDFEAVYHDLLSRSPEVRAAETRVSATRKQIERQQAQPIPNVEVQASVAYDDGGNDTIANLQVALPIPVHNDNRGNVAAAWANYRHACSELQRLKMSLRSRLADAFRSYERSERQSNRYQDVILPAASRNLELTIQGYQSGEYDLLRTIQARQSFAHAQLAAVDAAASLRMADAKLEGLLLSDSLGSDLPNAAGDNLQGVGLRDQALGGE